MKEQLSAVPQCQTELREIIAVRYSVSSVIPVMVVLVMMVAVIVAPMVVMVPEPVAAG